MILDEITEGVIEFEKQWGYAPEKVYVNLQESHDLARELSEIVGYEIPHGGLRVLGIPVVIDMSIEEFTFD